MQLKNSTSYRPNIPLIDEEALINGAKQNSKNFDKLYDKYFEQIFLFILKRVQTNEIASDITSQVFLKALQNISKFKFVGILFSSWLYRIARNEIYDQHKKNNIHLVLSIETKGVKRMAQEMVEEQTEQDFSELYKALKVLKEEDLELIELRFFEDKPFKEIGEILEMTENNAKVKTYRVLDKLKTHFKNG